MTVYRPPTIEQEPYVNARRWTVYRTPEGDHLCAYIANGHDGRVTSKIMNQNGRVLTTRSGRQYFLMGESGRHPEAQYVWEVWCHHNNVSASKVVDVSQEYEQKM